MQIGLHVGLFSTHVKKRIKRVCGEIKAPEPVSMRETGGDNDGPGKDKHGVAFSLDGELVLMKRLDGDGKVL